MRYSEEMVSVIIPTYNRANTILRSIRSVCDQTYSNIEIIVVDDASDDNTEEIVDGIGDDRIQYYKLEKNSGPSIARNFGVKIAKGKYVAFHDSDDEWVKDKLFKQIKKMKENDKFLMVYCPYMLSDGERTFQVPSQNLKKDQLEGDIYLSLLEKNKIGTPTMLLRKDLFDSIGGFDGKLKALEDWDLAIRISRETLIGYVDEPLVKAYFSPNSVNHHHVNLVYSCIQIIKKNKKYASMDKMKSLVQTLIEHATQVEDDIENLVVPDIVDTNWVYELLKYNCSKKNEWKEKYNVLMWIMEEAREFVSLLPDPVSVYGGGTIGKKLIEMLVKFGKKIDCVIDQNKGQVLDYQTVSIEKFCENNITKTCLITVPDSIKGYKIIEEKVREACDGQVINVYDLAQN